MDLIDIDVVGAQTTQRVIDLAHDSLAAPIAGDLSVLPFEPDLGGEDDLRAKTAGEGLADDLFGTAEAIDRRGVDDIDSMGERGPDRRNRLGFIRSAPHPAPNRPGADGDARDGKRRAGDVDEFHAATVRIVFPHPILSN